MLRNTIAAFAISGGGIAAAEQAQLSHTCDPTDVFEECRDLALRYSIGISPFPRDELRAKTLNMLALEQAKTDCTADFGYSDGCRRAREYILAETGRIRPSTGLDTPGAQALLDLREIAETGCERQNPQSCLARATFDYDVGLLLYRSQKARQSGQDSNQVARAYFAERDGFLALAREAAKHHIYRLQKQCDAGKEDACLHRDQTTDLFHTVSPDTETEAEIAVLYPSYSTACLNGDIRACVQLARNIATLGLEYEPTIDEAEAPQLVARRLETECIADNGPACFTVALLLTALERDPQALYTQSCRLHVAEGCEAIAWQAVVTYTDIPTPENLSAAMPLLQKACEMGRNVPCHVLEHLPTN
ncbi:hypothetical protein [Roseovarius sp. EL26]|uniref:hypothetical protein n=1 Tax=Roseovarius sp. EL26 TaxID=2126672 RepID=UPI000EA2424B|nr:hypothetical protein [Roseovarius sp. EL26]